MNDGAIRALIIAAAALGHGLLWLGALNRFHGMPFSRPAIRRVNIAIVLLAAGLPIAWTCWRAAFGCGPMAWADQALWLNAGHLFCRGYLGVCIAAAAIGLSVGIARIIADRLAPEPPAVCRVLNFPRAAPHPLLRIPGNQSLEVALVDREIVMPRWPTELDGLSLLHLSDLHVSPRLGRSFFTDALTCCAGRPADLAAVTGDILEDPECLDWLPDIFARLRAPLGVYWIRGNHELKSDSDRLRAALDDCGLICLSARWLPIACRGASIVLAGNELPWFPPAAAMDAAPAPAPLGPPRIALLHSPDQFGWAQREQFDLALAGHVHGGQVRLPLFGPLLAPSRRGLTYARRSVYRRGPTVMHVSRGLSAEWPLRIGCRPEVVRLVLRAAATTAESSGRAAASSDDIRAET